jgi:hypothetical protein
MRVVAKGLVCYDFVYFAAVRIKYINRLCGQLEMLRDKAGSYIEVMY